MSADLTAGASRKTPDLSFIMPCYNEEAIVGYTIPKLIEAFDKAGHHLELVAVDNGSHDRTGEIIKSLQAKYPNLVLHRVEPNEGYGNGVLKSIHVCTGRWIGIIPADGQTDADDVVKLYEAVAASDGQVLGKVRRRFRMDGVKRKIVSVSYNIFVRMLWPRLESIDLNGSPKILPANYMRAMELKSKGWLLDPEIMIKAHYMGIRILEFSAFGRMRSNGLSHVHPSTMLDFLHQLLFFRFSGEMNQWKTLKVDPATSSAPSPEENIKS